MPQNLHDLTKILRIVFYLLKPVELTCEMAIERMDKQLSKATSAFHSVPRTILTGPKEYSGPNGDPAVRAVVTVPCAGRSRESNFVSRVALIPVDSAAAARREDTGKL